MRETLSLVPVFGLTIGSFISMATANSCRDIELQQRAIVMKDEKGFEKIVLVGTVTELKPTRGSHPHHKWLVSIQVDTVCAGEFEGQTLSFAIHSPTKSAVEKGGQYVIDVARTQAGKYIIKDIEPCITR